MGMNHQFCIFSPVVLPCYATLVSSCLGSSILKPMQSTRSLAFGWDAASLILVSDPGPCLCWMPLLHVSGAGTASCLPCPVSLDQHGPQPQLLAHGWASPPPPALSCASALVCVSWGVCLSPVPLFRLVSAACVLVGKSVLPFTVAYWQHMHTFPFSFSYFGATLATRLKISLSPLISISALQPSLSVLFKKCWVI